MKAENKFIPYCMFFILRIYVIKLHHVENYLMIIRLCVYKFRLEIIFFYHNIIVIWMDKMIIFIIKIGMNIIFKNNKKWFVICVDNTIFKMKKLQDFKKCSNIILSILVVFYQTRLLKNSFFLSYKITISIDFDRLGCSSYEYQEQLCFV